MKIATQDRNKTRRGKRSEQVILFSAGARSFAVAADAVQEIRSTDGLAGAAVELDQAEVPKVKHFVERAGKVYFVVNACAHFSLRVTRPTLVLILRHTRAAVLVDSIERMVEIAVVHALPKAFTGDERNWYRGLAYLDDTIVPVIDPAGFLTAEEFARLDAAVKTMETTQLEGAV